MRIIHTPLQFNHPPFPNLTSQVLKCFLRTTSIIIDNMVRCNSESHKAQIIQAIKESSNPLLVLNLT